MKGNSGSAVDGWLVNNFPRQQQDFARMLKGTGYAREAVCLHENCERDEKCRYRGIFKKRCPMDSGL